MAEQQDIHLPAAPKKTVTPEGVDLSDIPDAGDTSGVDLSGIPDLDLSAIPNAPKTSPQGGHWETKHWHQSWIPDTPRPEGLSHISAPLVSGPYNPFQMARDRIANQASQPSPMLDKIYGMLGGGTGRWETDAQGNRKWVKSVLPGDTDWLKGNLATLASYPVSIAEDVARMANDSLAVGTGLAGVANKFVKPPLGGTVLDTEAIRALRAQEGAKKVSEGFTPLPAKTAESKLPPVSGETTGGFQPQTQADLEYPLNIVPNSVRPRATQTAVTATIPESATTPSTLDPVDWNISHRPKGARTDRVMTVSAATDAEAREIATAQGVKNIKKVEMIRPASTVVGTTQEQAMAQLSNEYLNTPPSAAALTTAGEKLRLLKANPNDEERDMLAKILTAPRSLRASWDVSAPFRQGLGMVHKKEFWKNLGPMFQAVKSEAAFRALQDEIILRPNFKLMNDSGLFISDLSGVMNRREEAIISDLAEKFPGVRASNRGYTVFLNKLRADVFDSMIRDLRTTGVDPLRNPQAVKEVSDFINRATGRGSLKFNVPAFGGEKEGLHWREVQSFENANKFLNATFFSPRLAASRIGTFNPFNYTSVNPVVRKEALKSLGAMLGFGTTMLSGASMMGADVSFDPRNSDFMKAKLPGSNTRLDPWGGFQQYIVLGARIASAQTASSRTGQVYDLGTKFGGRTMKDVLEDFGANKLSPQVRFLYDYANQSKQRPFYWDKETADTFIPMLWSDAVEITRDHPENLPVVFLTALGMSAQTYK
jgi:hypothetical protein